MPTYEQAAQGDWRWHLFPFLKNLDHVHPQHKGRAQVVLFFRSTTQVYGQVEIPLHSIHYLDFTRSILGEPSKVPRRCIARKCPPSFLIAFSSN